MQKLNFSELREVVEFINDNTKTESLHRKLKAKLKETSYDDFVTFKDSYENDYLSISEWIHSDYFEEDGYLYSNDDYCITREGDVERRDDVNFCDYYEEYTSENTETCYIGRNRYNYCSDAIDSLDLHYYDGDYYDSDALDRNDLCIIDGDIYRCDDCYFYNGEWNTEPEQAFIREYHNGNDRTHFVKFSDTPAYFIGFEIEKEDGDVKESIDINEFESNFPKWRKEKDGSLCEDSGYELVSPAFELNVDCIKNEIGNPILQRHINAKYSDRCGGHLNLSKNGLSGADFFATIEGYTPLIYALYPKRLQTDYCKGKSNKNLKDDRAKYQAIAIHSNHIEYRIFSAIPNVDTLIWRTKLMKAIVDNPTSCVKQAFLNANSVLREVLEEQYSTPERFQRLMARVTKFTMNYEGINPKDNEN